MTSLSERIELIEKAMEGVTPGPWITHGGKLGHKGDVFAPTAKQVTDCHHIARCFAPKPAKPVICELQAIQVHHEAITVIEANAAYIAACNPDRMRELLAAARKAEALQQEIAEKDAEIARLRKIIAECQWYWPGDDTSSDHCEGSAWEVVEANAARPGDVTEVKRGGVVEVMFCASLPAAEDSDSDDDFWVQEKTEDEARAKIEAEIARRARTLLNGGSDAQG